MSIAQRRTALRQNLIMIIIICNNAAEDQESSMPSVPITLVAGPSGSGKTTWIHERLSSQEAAAYWSLGSADLVDNRYLSVEFPGLQVLHESPEQLLSRAVFECVSAGLNIYIEIGFHVDLCGLVLPCEADLCQRVVLLPAGVQEPELEQWADVRVPSSESYGVVNATQLWRSPLTGQILDPTSLDTFWYELTQGAYGAVQRAKGIFDLVDGRAFYFNYVKGFPNTQYVELKVPRWFEGRPQRFSGIEVVGEQFDQKGVASTLGDCGLEDAAIPYYQAQIKASLGEPTV
jgi:hypothetical protein